MPAPNSNGKKAGKGKPPVEHQFKPGNSLGGRPKGSRNKLGEAFIEALHTDFTRHGADVIERVRVEEPATYMRVVAGILPKEVKIDSSPVSEMSDDELAALIDIVRTAVGPPDAAGTGTATKNPGKPPKGISPVH